MRHLLAAAAVLAACSSTNNTLQVSDDASTDASTADASTADASTADTSAADGSSADAPRTDGGNTGTYTMVPYVSEMPERSFVEADQVLDMTRDYRAVMETDAGRIVLDLYEDRTPITVNSFVFLALHHFFEGIAFHRVLENFVAQGGDPNTLMDTRTRWGTGGPGYTFDTETVDGLGFDGAGVLGMARAAARNTNGSQFFITLAATPSLNGMYTVFGRVTEGLDVLPRIARNQNSTTPPVTPTRITRVVIESRPR